ncbi:MAG: hypothetical protein OEL88_13295 [Sterolibacteriaceae bacterium MAG5]|nr:hypothetical protein [Candidatus Nitricoxidireducens bremensis]
MAPLGDHFPADKVKEHVAKQLVPGCVIRIPVAFPQVTKPKFLILVGDRDPDYLTFIVNSEVNQFVAKRPHLAQCQVTIDAANHGFLRHDSQVACHEVLALKRTDVVRELSGNLDGIKGQISQAVRDQIVAAVKFAVTLSAGEKSAIIEALS